MLSVQSPTSSLCVSPPAQTEGEKEKRGDSHRRNNYTALRGNDTCNSCEQGALAGQGMKKGFLFVLSPVRGAHPPPGTG